MNGLVYVFLRKDGAPLPPGCAGHVGWGFLLDGGERFYAGSTENPSGAFIVLPGKDNGWWGSEFASESAMLHTMRQRQYDGYKVATVRSGHPAGARKVADGQKGSGFAGVGNNCLDQTYAVLEAYGVKDLPWKQTHPSPNDWFAVFNGEYHNL